MGEFFKGWRRKIGVVSLVVACVFAAGWVRSYQRFDRFQSSSHTFFSADGAFGEMAWTEKHYLRNGREFAETIPSPIWKCPHYVPTVPLVLLSAYLLLVKPRVAKPKIVGENPE